MSGWSVDSMYHTVINVTDLDRSIAFYERLGFRVLDDRRNVHWPDFVATNFGMRVAQGQGVLMVLKADENGPMLDLIRWLEPKSDGMDPSVPADMRIPRILAFRASNVRALYDELKAEGFEFTNDFTGPFPELGIIGVCCVKDPDGTIVEFMELEPGVRHSQAKKALGERG
jgi:catechol 2,3-dioxygenase-like lactoylglutathione lyase family enzyme